MKIAIKEDSFYENWTENKLEDITEIRTGGTPSKLIKEYWGNGTIPWMVSGDIHKGVIKSITKKITELGFQKSAARLLPVGSIMVALNGQGVTKGMVAYLEIETTCNQSLAAIIPNRKFFNSKYLYFNLQNRYREIRGLSDLKARTGLNLSLLKGIKVTLPTIFEQNKIASILSTVDDLIENIDRLINSYTLLKKGLMQTLLTKGIGHTKFKKTIIGNIPDNWEFNKIKNIASVVTGKTPPTADKNNYGDKYPWVTPTDITDRKNIDSTERFLSEDGYKKAVKILSGSLLITCIASIGKNAVIIKDGSCNQQINAILPNQNINLDFYYYWFCNNKKVLDSYAAQTAVPILNKSIFENIYIPFPPIMEQNKIASILSVVDEYLETFIVKKENLSLLKKGLMQQLLTGKIRVKV